MNVSRAPSVVTCGTKAALDHVDNLMKEALEGHDDALSTRAPSAVGSHHLKANNTPAAVSKQRRVSGKNIGKFIR